MPSFTNVTTALKLKVDGDPLTYAQILKTVAITPSPITLDSGQIVYPPGLLVADISARSTLIAACDAATSTITLTSGDKTLALSLVDAFYWSVSSSVIPTFRADLAAAS